MFRLLIICFFFCVPDQTELSIAIDHFNARADHARGLQAEAYHIDKAIGLFENLVKRNQDVLVAGGYLMQSLNFKARFVLVNKKEKKLVYEKVILLGNELIKKYPKDGKIRFELLSAIALWSEIVGVMKSIDANVMAKMIHHTDQLIQNDSMYCFGGGWKARAAMHYKVPYIPLIMTWPDKKKGVAIMKNALRHFPTNVGCNFYYGEALYADGQKELAKVYFMLSVKYPGREGYILEDEFFKEKARKYLREL